MHTHVHWAFLHHATLLFESVPVLPHYTTCGYPLVFQQYCCVNHSLLSHNAALHCRCFSVFQQCNSALSMLVFQQCSTALWTFLCLSTMQYCTVNVSLFSNNAILPCQSLSSHNATLLCQCFSVFPQCNAALSTFVFPQCNIALSVFLCLPKMQFYIVDVSLPSYDTPAVQILCGTGHISNVIQIILN